MEQTNTVGSSKPGVAGRTPRKKKTPHDHSKGNHQNNGHHLDGLDKYFEVLPLVENFLNETDPQLKKSNGIFFTPYPVVSFIVRSIHAILKKKLREFTGQADRRAGEKIPLNVSKEWGGEASIPSMPLKIQP